MRAECWRVRGCARVCGGVKDASPALGRTRGPVWVLTQLRGCAVTAWSGQIRVMDAMRSRRGGKREVWRLPALRKMPGHWICRTQKLSFT